jgi:hypothetical protein
VRQELLVEQGLISTSRTRIAARPLTAFGRELLLATALRTGLTGLGAGHRQGPDPIG